MLETRKVLSRTNGSKISKTKWFFLPKEFINYRSSRRCEIKGYLAELPIILSSQKDNFFPELAQNTNNAPRFQVIKISSLFSF
jgi:hypothetical protein